ncbi:MAG: class I mannose-6-phosphate isomerase [Phycisphaerae bacterium]|nr:class I mannose-6-phosphate isomerase [Phycisphaerae bacterium]
MNLYPLKFEPIYKKRIWGGQKLKEIFGKHIPPLEKIGESWELADLPDDKSVIINGEFAGQNINSVIRKYPEEIIGSSNFSENLPLLIKFLDAEDILSVQVHPDEQTCKRMGRGEPKTECWYIISAAPDAVIYKGLKKGVTKEQFSIAIKNGTAAELLVKVPVKPGQCHFLPSGTVHSIGAGLLIAEIQTPSDTTYRVFDWNRVDDTGKARQLHIEEALESINFDTAEVSLPVTTVGRLVDCEYFEIDKGHQAKNCETLLSPGKMKTLIILTGFGTILAVDGTSVEFKAGDCLIAPAAYEGAIRFADDTQYLTITLRVKNE